MSNPTKRISKEIFKLAFNECFNLAWIFFSIENFKQAIKFKKNNDIMLNFKGFDFETDEEFDQMSGLNIEKVYESFLSELSLDHTINENENDEKIKTREQIANSLREYLKTSNEGAIVDKIICDTVEDGNEVGELVKIYFDSLLSYENNLKINEHIEFKKSIDLIVYANISDSIKKTEIALKQKDIKYIYESTFKYKTNNNVELVIKNDVLEIVDYDKKIINIYEAKAVSKPKFIHFYDLYFQKKVLEKLGYIVKKAKLVCLNNKHWNNGSYYEINFDNFEIDESKIDDELENIKKYAFDETIVREQNIIDPPTDFLKIFDTIYQNRDPILIDDLFVLLDNLLIEKYDGFENFINWFYIFLNDGSILQKDDFFCKNLVNISSRNKKYKFNDLKVCRHILNISNKNINWDKPVLTDFLSFDRVKKIIDKNGWESVFLESIVDKKTIKKFATLNVIIDYWKILFSKKIHTYSAAIKFKNSTMITRNDERRHFFVNLLNKYKEYPIYMYDFETLKHAIPRYKKCRSYQQIPYQYSIHVINDDKFDFKNENTMKHYAWLAQDRDKDPRPEFLKNFLRDIFSNGKGIYVAYFTPFEKKILKELIIVFPKFKNALLYIINNTIDLYDFFAAAKNEFLVYNPKFKKSKSIKKTQPGLNDILTYKDLKINNGMLASLTFRSYVDGFITKKLWDDVISRDMLIYCNRDTLAMVVVLQEILKTYKREEEEHENL